MIGSIVAKADPWVTVTLSVFSGALLAVYMIAYLYLMVKDRDALRSERFTLSKMAIEKNITGDSLRGFIEAEVSAEKLLQAPVEPTDGQQEAQ
jgi:hypothetical protein